MSTNSSGNDLMAKIKAQQAEKQNEQQEEGKDLNPLIASQSQPTSENQPPVGNEDTQPTSVPKLQSDPLQDILAAASQQQAKNPVITGVSSAAIIQPAMASKSNMAKQQPELPGYYSTNIGNVRLSRTDVVVAQQLRGQFYYPLNSRAAKYLEARVGKSVRKVKE